MTALQRIVCVWTISAILPVVLPAVAAADSLAPPPESTRVGVSDDLRRLVVQAMPSAESSRTEPPDVGELRLSLREAVVLAVKNNLDIVIAGYNPKITGEGITIAKAVFDPTFSLRSEEHT